MTQRLAPFLILCAILLMSGCGSSEKKSSISSILTGKELDAVMERSGDTLLVLDMYADWCGPCRMLAPTLEIIAQENKGKVIFYRVNVDQVPEASQAFKVGGIPLVVFVKNKKVVSELVGLQPKENYEKVIADNK
jgi:thioredoxin 1